MKITVDAFGGDNAPLAVIEGAVLAKKEYDVDIVLSGDAEKIKECAEENGLDISDMEIANAPCVIEMEDDPMMIIKEKSDCSMAVGMRHLADGESDAFVSAGSTAALVVGGSMIVKRIRGVKRASLATVIPCENGYYMLMDSGANAQCRPEMLMQFAVMGSLYMKNIFGIDNPRVGLLNIGTEETKGRELELETYALLKGSDLNFVGNVEAREVPLGACDVVITDGFTGNVLLKTTEGLAKFFSHKLKDMMLSGISSKIGAMFLLKEIKSFKKSMDYTEVGGAPLLGTRKPVIKAHGSSNANAFKNAIRQANEIAKNSVVEKMTDALSKVKGEANE